MDVEKNKKIQNQNWNENDDIYVKFNYEIKMETIFWIEKQFNNAVTILFVKLHKTHIDLSDSLINS